MENLYMQIAILLMLLRNINKPKINDKENISYF